MKLKLTLMVAMAVACASIQLTAMPTEEETMKAEPVVNKLLASERAALELGRKTRSEVAVAAMKLADEVDTDAAKLLLMKGAFVLYVRDGNLEKAVETMNALEAAISDMPPQSVTNMIETALLGVSKKEDGARLYKLLNKTNAGISPRSVSSSGLGRPGAPQSEEEEQQKATVDGYTWSYRVKNGEATILEGKGVGECFCAVSPKPAGHISIPKELGGLKVTSIGRGAFVNCSVLTSVTIPESVRNIGGFAFHGCRGLTAVTIPSSVTSIGFSAFGACKELTSVTILSGVASIGLDAFFSCSGLMSFSVDSGNRTYSSRNGLLCSKDGSRLVAGVNGDVTIPSGVTHIGERAFFDYDGLTAVMIPPSVTHIGIRAFYACGSLTSVTIGSGITSIREHAFSHCGDLMNVRMCGERPDAPNNIFQNCGKLKAIHVPANAKSWSGMKEWQGIPLVFDGAAEQQQTTVDGYTWSYRVKDGNATIVAEKDGKPACAVSPAPIGDVSIPATLNGVKVTCIGMAAFKYCKELTSVTIPEGVTYLDTWAFDSCSGLKSVTLPSSLMGIGYAAFGKCAKLTSVTIPNGVKSIVADAFNGCCSIKSAVIPESVTRIGDRAFCGCRELESVTIPAGVASIGKGVFGDCNALKLINVDSGNQAYIVVDGVLYTKDRSELVMYPNPPATVVIPEDVTSIRAWAFTGGSGMTSVTIPESVTNIGEIAFIRCAGLKSITIPSRVKSMGEHVFEQCVELTEVTMLGERPDAPETLFPGCGKLKAIHVPANAKSWEGMKDWFGIPIECEIEANH